MSYKPLVPYHTLTFLEVSIPADVCLKQPVISGIFLGLGRKHLQHLKLLPYSTPILIKLSFY